MTTFAVASLAAASLVVPAAAGVTQLSLASRGTASGAPRAHPDSGVNTWRPTGSMSVNRSGQTATTLASGRILVAGGGTASAELYDPASRTFTATGSMSSSRTNATATLLPNGDVLVVGGSVRGHQLASAEVYDPVTGTWSPTGSMTVARSGMTATLLGDGEVLVAGGGCNPGHTCNAGSFLDSLRSAELYDPTNRTWTRTGQLAVGRQFHSATLLQDGEVLVAGGFSDCDDDFCEDTRTAELYDPTSGLWSQTGTMQQARELHTATLLPDGDALVAGGRDIGYNSQRYGRLASAEIFEAASGTWSATGALPQPQTGATADLLGNGWVLLAGGGTRAAEVYEPLFGQWVPTAALNTRRTDGAAALLGNGDVLVTGGGVDTAEVYLAGKGPLASLAPPSVTFPAQQVGSTSTARHFTMTNNGDGPLRIQGLVVAGPHPGDFSASDNCSATLPPAGSCTVQVIFRPSATGIRDATVRIVDNAPSPQSEPVSGYGKGPNTWVPTGALAGPRSLYATATLLNGDILIAGGEAGSTQPLATAELYDPDTGRFTPTGSLNVARSDVQGTLLRNGDVLVAGGIGDNFVRQSSVEIYDPSSGTWSTAAPMHEVGDALTETTLQNGDVLVTGLPSRPEIYDPSTNTWTDTGPSYGVGAFSTATLLPDGRVLAAGDGTTSAGLYNPHTNSWTETGSLHVARGYPEAVLLPTGDVLIAGGRTATSSSISSAELYDPSTGTWSLTSNSMSVGRQEFGLTVTTGVALATGGCTSECSSRDVTATTDMYNPQDGYWFPVAGMLRPRADFVPVALRDGEVLVAGGDNYCCNAYRQAETYVTPALRVSPTSGPAGTTIKVTGNGFFAKELVKLTWDDLRLRTARTGIQGGFAVTVTVPPTSPGSHQIQARGLTSFAGAVCLFTVTSAMAP